MSRVSLNRIITPGRSNIFPGVGGDPYLDDLVWQAKCQDGITGYPTLTDSVAGNNATIYSAGDTITYPGSPAQVYPYFDGVNDYATAGNVAAANIQNNLAICMWINESPALSGVRFFGGKVNLAGHRQYYLYRYNAKYRFNVSADGANTTSVSFDNGSRISGRDVFLCGVYRYDLHTSSEMRLFMNAADPGVLQLIGTSSIAVGPLYASSTAQLSIAAGYDGSSFTYFNNMNLKRMEIFNVDASRIDDWIDGTNPGFRFAAGSGQ